MSFPPGPVSTDLHCAACGYSLHTLSPDAACPECGSPVAASIIPPLSASSTAWLRYQAGTMVTLAVGCLLTRLWQIPYLFVPGLHFGRTPAELYGSLFEIAMCLPAVGALAWAAVRISTPEPNAEPDDSSALVSRALRFLAAALVVSYVAAVATIAYDNRALFLMRPPEGTMYNGPGLPAYAFAVAEVLTFFLALRFVRTIARRTFDDSLQRHATLAVWLMPISQCLQFQYHLASSSIPWTVLQFPRLTINLGEALAVIVTAALLARVYDRLRRAADDAQATASAPAEPAPAPPPAHLPSPSPLAGEGRGEG